MRVVDFLTEDKWTRCSMAKDSRGRSVSSESAEASRWCLAGAIDLCYTDIFENANARIKICKYIRELPDRFYQSETITWWNDQIADWPDVQKMLEELQI